MELEAARQVLAVLCAAYPTYPVGEDTAQLYLELLTKQVDDPNVAHAAVETWVISERAFPRPNEMLVACQSEARAQALRRHGIERPSGWRGRDGDDTVTCPRCGDTGWVEVETEETRHAAECDDPACKRTHTGQFSIRPCTCDYGQAKCDIDRWASDYPPTARARR